MSHLHEPLTLPKHPKLLEKINDLTIAIQLYKVIQPDNEEDVEKIAKAKENHKEPTWAAIVEVLREAYNAINEQRENPRKH